MLNGAEVVLPLKGKSAEPELHGQRVGPQRRRVLEQRPGCARVSGLQMRFRKPNQRGQIVRPQLARLLEQLHRTVRLASGPVDVPEVVRPATITRPQRLGVAEARFGFTGVLRYHEEFAHLAVRPAELGRSGAGVSDGLHQLGVLLPELLPHGLRCAAAGEIRERNRLDGGGVRGGRHGRDGIAAGRCGLARGAGAAGEEAGAGKCNENEGCGALLHWCSILVFHAASPMIASH